MKLCVGEFLDRSVTTIDDLGGLAAQAVGKFPNGREIALLRRGGQFLRNPAKPKWIAPESNPKRVLEGLSPGSNYRSAVP